MNNWVIMSGLALTLANGAIAGGVDKYRPKAAVCRLIALRQKLVRLGHL